MPEQPGPVVLFGSGETSASAQKVFDWLLRRLPLPVRVAIVETPAGLELNSAHVAGRVGAFLNHRLQNYRPQVTIVPARKRGTPYSPDNPEIAALILGAHAIFLGPGSPTYAVRQLRDSLTWQTIMACHRQGAALALASAATVAAGAHALPVYEIYKVGEDLHWRDGLDLLGPYGLSLALISHWNNHDGGADLDTSRCWMGHDRFEQLMAMLPPGTTMVGIDEHTALVMDLASGDCRVMGRGGVSVPCGGEEQRFERGHSFRLSELGPFHRPLGPVGLPAEVEMLARAAHPPNPPEVVPSPPPRGAALGAGARSGPCPPGLGGSRRAPEQDRRAGPASS